MMGGKVVAHFDEDNRGHLSILPRGKLVTVDGQLDEINALSVTLENCEFIDL